MKRTWIILSLVLIFAASMALWSHLTTPLVSMTSVAGLEADLSRRDEIGRPRPEYLPVLKTVLVNHGSASIYYTSKGVKAGNSSDSVYRTPVYDCGMMTFVHEIKPREEAVISESLMGFGTLIENPTWIRFDYLVRDTPEPRNWFYKLMNIHSVTVQTDRIDLADIGEKMTIANKRREESNSEGK